MGKFTRLTSVALSFICLFSLTPSIMAKESEIIVNEKFDGTAVPEGFYCTEEKGTTLTMVDGQIKYQRPNTINGTGEFWYDLSDLGTLSAQHCNKLIIEYDVAYEALRNDKYCAFKNTPVILDGSGKKYLDTYIEVSTTYSRFVSAQGWTKVPFKIWNASETDTDVYYKTRVTIDIAESKQTLEIAEMELGTTDEPVYQSFGTKNFYEAVDGTLGKIDFIIPAAWGNATISIDNFKITREELWADMELVSVTPENGSEFKSNKPEITVEFTNVVDEETLSSIVLTYEDALSDEADKTKTVETDITVSGNKVTVVPSGYLSYNTEYTLEIGEGIKDAVGQSLLNGAVYSYRTMPDPTDRKGTIYARDTFDSAETIDNYSWTNDSSTTAVIENGLLKYKRKLVQPTGYIDRKLDIQKDTDDIIVFEYDLYPIDKRHDKTSTYEFEFPAVLDDAGKKYCDFYIQPVSGGSTVCKLVKRSGGVLDTEFKLGTDYMYHITLVLDMVNEKYTSVYEEIGLTDGSSRTFNCPWTAFYESVNGNISAFRFAGGHEWGSAQFNFDNFICYSPEAVEFDAEASNISDGCEIPARSKLNLSFTNSLAADSEKAVTVFDKDGNAVEIISTLTNGGKTIEIEAADGRFEYNSQYSLKLDGSMVMDIFGNAFSDDLQMSFNTTGVPPAKIKFNSDPEYKMLNEQGEETNDITLVKTIQAKLEGTENISEDEDSKRNVCLIVGIYDADKNLRKYVSEEILLEKGNKEDLSAELLIDDTLEEGYTVRVYVWDGLPGAPYSMKN